MSRFAADWLALREPADHAALNAALRARLVAQFDPRATIRVVDLGSGRGSNMRALAPAMPMPQDWVLVDNDGGLLVEAAAELGRSPMEERINVDYLLADLASDDLTPLVAGADLVTASAFFDLASQAFIERLAAAIARAGATIYATLTYDGMADFHPPHAADEEIRAAFNRHQRSDKGFGPAAGPAATGALARALSAHGYSVEQAASPWRLDATHAALRAELEQGIADAAIEEGSVSGDLGRDWLRHRAGAGAAAVTIIGHRDLLATPRLA